MADTAIETCMKPLALRVGGFVPMGNKYIYSTPLKRITKNLQARVLGNELGRLEFALIVSENTTLDDIKIAWNGIKIDVNKILQRQGTDPNDFYQNSRLSLARLYFIEGFSYTEVAMDANYDILCNIIQTIDHMDSGNIVGALEFFTAITDRLVGLGMKNDIVLKLISDSIEEVRKGNAPWSLTDGPVTKQRIVDLIRQLDRELKKGILVLKPNPPGVKRKSIRVIDIVDINRKTWARAEELLNQLPKSGGLLKIREAEQRYRESLKG